MARPKEMFPLTFKKKVEVEPQKYMIFDVLVPEMKKISSCLCLTVEHTDSTLNISKCS